MSDLDELGISLINIRSTGFRNVGVLFHSDRIRKRCSIITDLDTAFIDTTQDPSDTPASERVKAKARGSQTAGLARKVDLGELGKGNPWLDTFFATHTFEVDFITAGNGSKIVGVLNQVYKDAATISASKAELESTDILAYGRRVLTMAENAGKGWFAILIGKTIDHHTIIPGYILKAISFAHGPLSTSVLFDIISYRLGKIAKDPNVTQASIADFNTKLAEFRSGALDVAGIRKALLEAFPADEINNALDGL